MRVWVRGDLASLIDSADRNSNTRSTHVAQNTEYCKAMAALADDMFDRVKCAHARHMHSLPKMGR